MMIPFTFNNLHRDWLSPALFDAGVVGAIGTFSGALLGKVVIVLNIAVGFNPYGLGAAVGVVCLISTLAYRLNLKTATKISLFLAALPVGYLIFSLSTVTFPLLVGIRFAFTLLSINISLIVYSIFRAQNTISYQKEIIT